MATHPTEPVIHALAEPARRALLDALRHTDGQSVSELAAAVPHLGRHAVLKHLGVLEAAGLVTTHKTGRVRRCYLNPVPIVTLARRWLDDYALGWGASLHNLKDLAETKGLSMSATPLHRYAVMIDASPKRVWQALTQETASWFFATTLNSTLAADSPYTYTYPNGTVAAEGTVLRAVPGEVLELTFSPTWDDDGPRRTRLPHRVADRAGRGALHRHGRALRPRPRQRDSAPSWTRLALPCLQPQDLGRDRLPDGRLTRPAEWTRAPRDMTTTARSAGQTSHVTPPEPRAARWAR
ncbi:MAG: helix-turn-helix domain-containing protein [Dermatophilaceae bacterium]